MLLTGIFAVLALLLTAVGIYGVASYSFAQRTREIGIRMALGASRSSVVILIVREGLLLAVCGVGIGGAGALALSRLIAGQLFEVNPADPLTFGGAALFVILITLLACSFPAIRTARADPMGALRCD
jgi:ABC-type antimicrobial peptide transport system permease subunit